MAIAVIVRSLLHGEMNDGDCIKFPMTGSMEMCGHALVENFDLKNKFPQVIYLEAFWYLNRMKESGDVVRTNTIWILLT